MKNKLHLFAVAICIAISLSFTSDTSEKYGLDVGHTYIGFDVERFLVGEVTGRFNEFTGSLSMSGEDATSLQVNVTINTNSLDTNNDTRDGHLKSPMWLDTAQHEQINFTSKSVSKKGDSYEMSGELTIKGITKTVSFPVEILGPFQDPTKQTAIGIKADLMIDRFDYGIKFNKKMDNGSFFIGNEVKIKIRALAYKQKS